MDQDYIEWKGWQAEAFGEFSPGDDRYFSWHAARALGARPGPLRILEIGFGNGRFIGWARARGHQVEGVEINRELVAQARRAGVRAETGIEALDATARFDLIAAFDVIEHILQDRLQVFLTELAARLADGGRILLRFPNGESPLGRMWQYGDLTHLTVLSLGRIEQLCALCDLRVVASGELLPWTAWHGRKKVRAGVRQALRAGLEHAIGRLYFDHRVRFAPNEIVVLERDSAP